MKRETSAEITQRIFHRLSDASTTELALLYKRHNTTAEGLESLEAQLRQEVYGPNQIDTERPSPWFIQLVKAFLDPFSGILLFLASVSFVMDVLLAAPGNRSWKTVIVICVMIGLSGFLRFFQEHRSSQEAEKLKALVHTTATVKRSGGGTLEVKLSEIVPGDIVCLGAGDMIPADVRLISCKDLFVSQSSLTGESEPVEKYDALRQDTAPQGGISLSDLNNICFMGTNVISGTATAIALATGNDTYFGSIAKTLTGKRAPTSFDKGINSVSWVLIRFMLVMVPIVLLVNGLTKGNWLDAFLFAISIAVGLTPEMLPMIVTTNLAKGAVTMAKKKTVVKRLNAIQNFGAMDILCTDKTGTLTLDKIVLERHLDIHGNEDDRVLRHAYLNSFFQTSMKNLMDVAVIEYGDKLGFRELEGKYHKVDEIPFDFVRRRMSVVVQAENGERELVTKGAVEEMLSVCAFAEYHGEVLPLTGELREEVKTMAQSLNAQGMRVLGVAQKHNVPDEVTFGVADEADMILMGYIGFLDPPKESASAAIQALHEHGVRVKILTGDNEIVTQRVCEQVGLAADHILLGGQIDAMTDDQLAKEAEVVSVFAKLSPLQKSRIIKVLRSNGHTVGYMGDGINDAAALRQADVGISVDTAMDIAKESADIILLEKNLMVLEDGVLEGRRTFGNIIKYIKITASSNFGNMFSIVAASAFLPFLPMLPVQILLLNLIYDFSCISIPWDNMDPEFLKTPRRWDASSVSKFMVWLGPTSSVFDITTYLLMFFVVCPLVLGGPFGATGVNSTQFQALFNAGWFVESLWSQTLVIHMIRTPKIPFLQSRASLPVLLVTTAGMVIGTLIPYTPLGALLGMYPMPAIYFLWLVGMIVLYMLLATLLKKLYARRYGSLL